MATERQRIEYKCLGTERAGDTLCLAEFEPECVSGNLAEIGSGESTAFLRFNKNQKRGVVYHIVVERESYP